MKYTKVLPYILVGSLVITPMNVDGSHDVDHRVHSNKNINAFPEFKQSDAERLQHKAQELCDSYISLVLQGQQNIKHSDMGHSRAVKSELPGAPVGFHCIYGQYTQLNRALNSLGDTLSLIPYTSRHSCPRFRSEMRKKYSTPEYAGALHDGKMLKPEAYKRALDAFLKHNNVTNDTPDSVRQSVIAKFRKNNYSVDELHPGTILIIQKSANPNNTHAVMFLGRGRVEKGSFVSDENGQFMYAGYNNESIADIFAMYNTDRIFAADIYNIALTAYTNEFESISKLNDSDLFKFVYDMPKDNFTIMPRRDKLQQMAYQKYFDKTNFKPARTPTHTNVASVGLGPLYLMTHKIHKTK